MHKNEAWSDLVSVHPDEDGAALGQLPDGVALGRGERLAPSATAVVLAVPSRGPLGDLVLSRPDVVLDVPVVVGVQGLGHLVGERDQVVLEGLQCCA